LKWDIHMEAVDLKKKHILVLNNNTINNTI
jgi:hypothetical protein